MRSWAGVRGGGEKILEEAPSLTSAVRLCRGQSTWQGTTQNRIALKCLFWKTKKFHE